MRRAPGVTALAALAAGPACSAALDLEPPPIAVDAPYWTFSDDFERGELGQWSKTARSTAGALDVARTGAYAGCCALHARVDAGEVGFQYAMVAWPQTTPSAPPLTTGTIAVRARIKPLQLDDDTRQLSISEGGTGPTAYATAGLGATGTGGVSWGFLLHNPTTDNYVRRSSSVEPASPGWQCVELVVNVDASAGHLSIFTDDAALPTVQGDTNTTVHTGWDSATIGLGYASGGRTAEVLIDDVEIALFRDVAPTRHLGCR